MKTPDRQASSVAPVAPRRQWPIGVVALAALLVVLLVGIVVGILALGGFFTEPSVTHSPAEIVRMTPTAIATAPGLRYRLSIETGGGGGVLGLDSSGQIDLQAHRFAGSADRGRGASMPLFGGPDSGSLVLADGLFVQADGGPWEAVPVENAAPLRVFVDPTALSRAVGGALEQAQIDPAVRTEACGSGTCQVVGLLLPPQVSSDLAALVSGGQAEPPPGDLFPIEAELWLDPETGFPVRVAVRAVAGPTTTTLVLDLERLDLPPAIAAPVP